MRHRRVLLAFLTAVLTLPVIVAAGQTAGPEPPAPAQFFRDELLKDAKTTSAIKSLLKTNAGFVDPNVQFADLTGDGKSDAVVAVTDGGAAGGRAVYVFSIDGASKLRAVYRNQLLYRVVAFAKPGVLSLDVPKYAPGDDVCCPAKIVQRSYTWDAKHHTLVRSGLVERDGPGAAAQ